MTTVQEFDVVFIGGGPAGYVGAIKSAQLGMKTACVEKFNVGGTCLNVGCIPSKALLQSSHKYHDAQHMADHGVEIASVKLNLKKMMERKTNVVSSLVKGIEGLFLKNKVTHLKGLGSFVSQNELLVTDAKGNKQTIKSKNFVIATGSEVMQIPGIKIDEKQIVSSTGALSLDKVPGTMLVIGGGVIGLEMASVWSRLGAKVEVVEFSDRLVASMDVDVSKEMKKVLEKQGISFKLSSKVVSAAAGKKGIDVVFEPAAGGAQEKGAYDIVLVAVGRRANTDGLALENAGLKADERGKLMVNDRYQTSVPNIYAVGDVIYGPMLAHKAEEEGIAAVENIAGQHGHVNYDAIPGVVYTHPEAASVGKTEDELKKAGIEYKAGKFPFLANSRARANGESDGFVKILACAKTDQILGAHIVSPNAGELIQEIVVGMEFKAASEDLARTSHGHPGLSEAVKEAALATFFKPIHM